MNHHETPPVSAFHIEKMPHGGFVVTEAPMLLALMTGQGSGRFYGTVYAATDIADALGFIGDKLDPVKRSPGETTPDLMPSTKAKENFICSAGALEVCVRKHPDDRCEACPYRKGPVADRPADGSVTWLAPESDPA